MVAPVSDPAVRPDLKALRRRPLFASLWVPLLGLLGILALVALAWSLQQTTTVIVVRHAEKLVDGSTDPGLSPTGVDRAARLAHQLRTAGIAAVYTTPYRRTRQTAAVFGLESQDYDARDAEAAVARVLEDWRGRTVVMVGHSNTVGDLVRALGGEAPAEISEGEYDHLWVVTVPRFGPVKTLHLQQL